MATARVEDEPLKCPICYEYFNRPRQLLGCLHVFCENCLLTYIGNVKSDDDAERTFQCPVCRNQVSVSLASTELSEWVKSLELKFDLESCSTDLEEGLVKDSVCGPCKEIEKVVFAETFCIDCQEYLCKSCSRIIHAVKVSKCHSMLDLKMRLEGGKEVVTQPLLEYFTCSRHSDKTVSHICQEHDDLCCINCIVENHRHCIGVKDLKDPKSLTNTKTDASKMKDQIQNAFLQIEVIIDFRKNDVAEEKENVELICAQIREIRTKLNTVFDALEDSIQTKTKVFAKNYSVEADDEYMTLKEKKQQLTALLSLIGRIETDGTDSQLFIVIHKLRSKVIDIENEIVDLKSSYCRRALRLQKEKQLNVLMEIGPNDTSKLATVSEELSVVILPAFLKKNLLDMTAKKISEHYILAKTSPKNEPTYSGVLSLETGQLMLVDNYYGLCCLTDKDYKPTASCYSNPEKPFCATRVKTGLIAVSVPNQKKVYLLSNKEESENIPIKDVVNTRLTPKALCGLKNGDIAVSWNTPVAFGILAFRISHPASYEETAFRDHDTAGRAFKTFDYMAVDEERSHVIQPCKTDKAVYCFDFCGNPKFAYKHGKLVCPNGVACDGQGNIYICDVNSSSIHVVSAEGVGTRVITEGCPGSPLAIAFHSDGIQFAVTNNSVPWTRVTIFKLSQE